MVLVKLSVIAKLMIMMELIIIRSAARKVGLMCRVSFSRQNPPYISPRLPFDHAENIAVT